MTFDTELRRRRLTILFRVVLALPAAVVLAVWGLLAAPVLILAWPSTIVRGRMPRLFHRVLRGYLRYAAQCNAWFNIVSGSYPRPRRRDVHPVQVVAQREAQGRSAALARPLLALPGLVLGSVFGVVLGTSAVAAWFVVLVRGRTTAGLRELGAFCLRYQVEALAYLMLLSPRAPKLEPPAD